MDLCFVAKPVRLSCCIFSLSKLLATWFLNVSQLKIKKSLCTGLVLEKHVCILEHHIQHHGAGAVCILPRVLKTA